MIVETNGDTLIIKVDPTIYSIDILHKCFYWYGSNFTVDIENGNTNAVVTLHSNTGTIPEVEAVIEKIKNDLVDFKLRDIITKETKTIRELIIAKAFAYYDEGEDPKTNVSDPVGFSPQNIALLPNDDNN